MDCSEMSESEKPEETAPETEGKIRRTLNSMIKSMQVSDDEVKYRVDNFDNVDVEKDYLKYLKCTKCNLNFQKFIKRGDSIGIHPLLGVLMCDSCCDYYGDGNFSLDSEGEDKYCRWCGEGGTIFACSKCICGFCDMCIKKHFGEEGLEAVEKDDYWICYFCNPQPLWYLRSICSLAKEAAKSKQKNSRKSKESISVKKKRRRIENLENDIMTSSESSLNGSTNESPYKRRQKRKRHSRLTEKLRNGESSSSEDEKENHLGSRKRTVRSKKQAVERDEDEDSTVTDAKKKSKVSGEEEFRNKRKIILDKFKSIWKLTQTVTEVGLNSSRKKLQNLSRARCGTLDHLRKEHEDLKSCINVLVSSLSTASNSVDSIKEDLTFDMTKDDTESFRSQEIKLKRFAEKFHEELDDPTSVDSDEDSFRKERKKKKGRKKDEGKRKSEPVKKRHRDKSDKNSEEEQNSGGEDKSKSLVCDSGSDKKENSVEKEKNGEEGSDESDKNSSAVKPFLKVKSFARMLDDNVYDKNKAKEEHSPIVIDLDSDESEIKNKESPKKDEKTKNSVSNEGEKKPPGKEAKNQTDGKSEEEDKGKEHMLQKSTDDAEKTEKSSSESEAEMKKGGRKKKQERISTDGENEMKKQKSKGKGKKSKSSYDEEEAEKEESPSDKGDNAKKQATDSVSQSSKTSESEDENEKQDNCEKKNSQDEKSDKDESSQAEKERNKESDCLEETKNNTNEDGNEKSGEESKDSTSMVNEEEKESTKASDNEDSKRDSSSSEEEKRKKSPLSNKKSDSSDDDSKSSTDNERKAKRRRGEKKPFKVSFEKFKRKREKFLKSSKETSEPEREKEKTKVTKVLCSSESESENKVEKKSVKPKRRILASSDEEAGENKKVTTSSEESEKENQKSEESEVVKTSSGSESSLSEKKQTKKRERRRKRWKGSSDSSEEGKKTKKKRRESISDSSEDEKTEKRKKGRRNIKKILKKDSLEVETKEALKNEEERKKRLKERQKLFDELFPQEEGAPKKLILDFNPETKEPLVIVHKKLMKHLKPHQIKGVKFMWDSCFESVEKLEEDSGSGCILAHCMGLGKTLQVVTLVHTVMNHDLGVNTVLVICPLSTVSNWIREFETWLANVRTDPITLYDLVKYKRPEERLFHVQDWHENGGVLVLSYDLFRTLTQTTTRTGKKVEKRRRKNQPLFEKALIDPGPDLVICDEGHLLKNEDTSLSKCVSRIKTSRRIVLTGTPLQNNLIEYHCMVQFVKPNILGTKKEFCNRFVNPINNGQFEDSTELDVKIMKKRSHVLHSMLDGCIQRFDYSVLTPFLPEKHEYVLSIALTDTQMKVYSHFLDNLSARAGGSSRSAGLFNDYHHLQRIWTHPRTMLMQSDKDEAQKELASESEGSLKDFVVSGSEESDTPESSESITEIVPRKRLLRSNANDPEVQKALEEEEEEEKKSRGKHWWDEFYDEKAYDDLRESNKLILLFSLLKHCAEKKDKLLVFSQSLYSLDLIEYFLAKIDENSKKDEETLCGHMDDWILGTDYFRLDGSTTSEMRDRWCKAFNKESNFRARLFLISTKAGGLGINLYAANRVVIFDASWNPSHDLQSIFRVYRFGQKKPCFVYRFLSEGTMEEKIYERQVTKLSLAHRVVDEHQIGRHYTMGNLQELYAFQPTPKDQRKVPNLPKDEVLADILAEHKDIVVGYHEHDSLLENKQEEELTEEERKAAWKEYEEEKVQKTFHNTATEHWNEQIKFLQAQQFAKEGPPVQQFINPVAMMNMGARGTNLMHTNIPLEFLERGVRLGVIPVPNESLDSYIVRILNKEGWMKGRVAQGH